MVEYSPLQIDRIQIDFRSSTMTPSSYIHVHANRIRSTYDRPSVLLLLFYVSMLFVVDHRSMAESVTITCSGCCCIFISSSQNNQNKVFHVIGIVPVLFVVYAIKPFFSPKPPPGAKGEEKKKISPGIFFFVGRITACIHKT